MTRPPLNLPSLTPVALSDTADFFSLYCCFFAPFTRLSYCLASPLPACLRPCFGFLSAALVAVAVVGVAVVVSCVCVVGGHLLCHKSGRRPGG